MDTSPIPSPIDLKAPIAGCSRPRRRHYRHARCAVLLALLALLCRDGRTDAQEAEGTTQATRRVRARALTAGAKCSAKEIARTAVEISGIRALYVEPSTFVSAGRHLLLAGIPNYLWYDIPRRDSLGAAKDSVFGAVRDPSGKWSLVPHPLPGRFIADPRAIALGDGRWEVFFIQIPRLSSAASSDSTTGIWYGQLRGNRWERIERVNVPPNYQVRLLMESPLTRHGDTLTWVAPISIDKGIGFDDVLVIERVGTALRHRLLGQIAFGAMSIPDSAQRRRVVLLYPDPNANSGRYLLHMHSLAVPSQQLLTYDTGAPNGAETIASLDASARDVLAIWNEQREDGTRFAAARIRRDGAGKRIPFPAGLIKVFPLMLPSDRARHFFLGDARAVGPAADGATSSLHLIELRGDSAFTSSSLENPFALVGAALRIDDETIVVTGPVLQPTPSGSLINSLLLTIGLQCRD